MSGRAPEAAADRRQVTFHRPFRLGGVVGEQPAGIYTVETAPTAGDATAHAHPVTRIRLPLPAGAAGSALSVVIDAAELAAALRRDAAAAP